MSTTIPRTTQLGELVAAVIDEAEQHTKDPREVSRLAAMVVARIVSTRAPVSARADPLGPMTEMARHD